jgi:hypothetical protein
MVQTRYYQGVTLQESKDGPSTQIPAVAWENVILGMVSHGQEYAGLGGHGYLHRGKKARC